MSELIPCPFCGGDSVTLQSLGDHTRAGCVDCGAEVTRPMGLYRNAMIEWNTRPIEDALQARAEKAEKMVERLMRMVEDRFVLLGNSLDGHLQDCNCAVFLSSRMERDAWSELCYEWHGIYSDWQSANGHQAGKVSENEGSEG